MPKAAHEMCLNDGPHDEERKSRWQNYIRRMGIASFVSLPTSHNEKKFKADIDPTCQATLK